MMKKFLFDEESGQGMVEYALILALIAVVCIAVFMHIGNGIKSKGGEVDKALNSAAPAGGTGTGTGSH